MHAFEHVSILTYIYFLAREWSVLVLESGNFKDMLGYAKEVATYPMKDQGKLY
jgi:hypothetical protein